MAQPTTGDGPRPPMGLAAWAHPIQAPSGQQHPDFAAVSAGAAPGQHQLVGDFHRQPQLHPPHLVHHQQPHLQQPQQQHYALYDPQYYNASAEQYASVPFTQAPVERHPYFPSQLGQLPDSGAVNFNPAPALSQPQPPAAFNQSFTSDDAPVFTKLERSPSSPPRQQIPTSPPQPAHPAGRTHRRQQSSVDQPSAMPAQVEAAATPSAVGNRTTKSASNTPTRKSLRDVPSPTAGKKRSREEADIGGDDDGSGEPEEQQKKRGRPRLTGGGESRDERRRKQIREAQRAYRNRKDNRIVELEEQVERLEREKMDMSRDLGSVLDLLRNQGIAQTSAAIARRFDEICQKYPLTAHDYPEGDAQSVMSSNTGRERFGHPSHPRQTLGTISSASSDHHGMMPGAQVRPPAQGPNLSFGSSGVGFYPPETLAYEVIAQPTPENASFPSYAPDPRAPGTWIEQPPVPPHPQQVFFQQQQVGAEQALVNNPMANPDSSAASEATFGRRLQRRTLERGLSLAQMDNPPPDRFGAVFGFCLLVESRNQIINRLKSCLHSFKEESLNYWRFPFSNLGGAGFSSERAASGLSTEPPMGNQGYVESFKPQHSTGFAMGPFSAQVESVKDSRLDKRMQIKFPGFEGEFLDAEEAERYLRDRGIRIPPFAEFVEVEISTNDFGDGPETGTAPANLPASGTQDSMANQKGWQMAARKASEDAITTMFSDGTVTGAADTGAMNPFLCPAVPLGSWTSTKRSNPTFKATIRVSVLVEEMVNSSVCLGRTPGLRAKDIDRAVKIASGLYKSTT